MVALSRRRGGTEEVSERRLGQRWEDEPCKEITVLGKNQWGTFLRADIGKMGQESQ